MKEIIQNILAQHSKSNIAYLCSKCGKEVKKEATLCDYCGVKLGQIRCPFCNFRGSIDDFKFDTCPKCGKKNKSNIDHLSINNVTQNNILPFSLKLFWFLFILLLVIIISLVIIFINNFNLI